MDFIFEYFIIFTRKNTFIQIYFKLVLMVLIEFCIHNQ